MAMQKIASPQELQAELRSLMAFIQGHGPGGKPDRDVLAGKLRDIADRVAGAGGQLPKAKYKQLFQKIRSEAIKMMGDDREKPADYWLGRAADKHGLDGYTDFQLLAKWAGERLRTTMPQAPSKGAEERIDKAAR